MILAIRPGRSILAVVAASTTIGGSGQTSRTASGRFRRTPATGALQEQRLAWGKVWGQVNSSLAKRLRAGGM